MNSTEKEKIDQLSLKGLGYKAIARELRLTADSVKGYCKRHHHNVPAVQNNIKIIEQESGLCLHCKRPVQQMQRGRTKKFCSDACRYTWWSEHPEQRNQNTTAIYHYTCPHCGKRCSSYGNQQRKYCSHDCYIKARFWNEETGGEVLVCINAGAAHGELG